MGAPITMSLELQADAAVGHLEGYIEALINQVEREKLANGDIQVREPVGICGLITPWNWPVNQIALKVRPALAADGGGLIVHSVEGHKVNIHYQGACGSCPSSTTGTLQYIEQFLKEAIHPDVEVQAS